MPRVSHLLRRNGIYWFKIDLPDDLAGQPLPPSIPQTIKQLESPMRAGRLKTAVWLSLRTTVEREAKQRVGIQIAQHASLFDTARAILTGNYQREQPVTLTDDDQLPATSGNRIVHSAICLPRPKSSNAPAGAESIGGLTAAPLKVPTITTAFQSWSSGGGVKGAQGRPPLTRSPKLMQPFAGSLNCSETYPYTTSTRGMAASIGTQSAEYPKAFPQT
ncbi:hypothetical protein ACVWZ6_008459 [Bradyrhizobium sp. GM6.1]